ncbi:MAG: outer membrane beta-barrel protein [Limisphaerales bacterium]
MKTIVTCASIAAVGVVGLNAQGIVDPTPVKPFKLSAAVRGFYDSNYTTASNNPLPGQPEARDSWGVNVAPSIALELPKDLTTLRLSYDFDYRYYEDRVDNEADMTHQIKLSLDHRFSERYKIEVFDSFVIGQEPEVLNPDNSQSTYLRTQGDNMRNFGGFGLLMAFSEKWGSRLGYQNTFYDYEESGSGSRSALLDRMEHLATADVRYQLSPDKVGLLGYQYGYTDQSSSDPLAVGSSLAPSIRNRESHYAFVGLDQDLSAQLSYKIRAGGQFANYPNATDDMDDSLAVPYADAILQYRYAERNQFQFGVKYGLNQTDVALRNSLDLATTTDATALTVYGGVVHRLLPRLFATARAQWQLATFNDGGYDGYEDNYYGGDFNLTYELNRFLSIESGYNYDRVDSDIGYRTYTRHRGYLGIRGSF